MPVCAADGVHNSGREPLWQAVGTGSIQGPAGRQEQKTGQRHGCCVSDGGGRHFVVGPRSWEKGVKRGREYMGVGNLSKNFVWSNWNVMINSD